MALIKPRVGQQYVLAEQEGLGIGTGALRSGTIATVESIHNGDVAGVGGDIVLVVPGETVEIDGEEYTSDRRVSVTKDMFSKSFHSAGGK